MFFDAEHALDVSNHNFMMAFGVSDYMTHETKFGPSFVRWLVEIVETDGDEAEGSRIALPYHKCNETDKARLFKPSMSS